MAITTQGKLNELMGLYKTDGSVHIEYNNRMNKYQESKRTYRSNQDKLVRAQDALTNARDRFHNATLLKRLKAYRALRQAKKAVRYAINEVERSKHAYKQNASSLRGLKRKVREQYRANKEYAKFFKDVSRAQQLGIKLPKYIVDAYIQQKSNYLSETFTVDKNGSFHLLSKPLSTYSKDVSRLIQENRQNSIKEALGNTVTQIKDAISPKEQTSDNGR